GVRVECEHAIEVAGLVATILRPWYVIGPGHRWPLFLKPAYSILEAFPSTRASAVRLGVVRLEQMVAAMVDAIEKPPKRTRVLETPEIRAAKAWDDSSREPPSRERPSAGRAPSGVRRRGRRTRGGSSPRRWRCPTGNRAAVPGRASPRAPGPRCRRGWTRWRPRSRLEPEAGSATSRSRRSRTAMSRR